MDADRIEREIVIKAPPARVWAALTEPEQIGTWFADSGAAIDLRPGGAMTLRWKDHGVTRTTIERIDPERYFAWRWTHTADTEPAPGNATLVEFFLTPDGDGTRLRVVESGFRALTVPEEVRLRIVSDNTQGWQEETAELRDFVERRAA